MRRIWIALGVLLALAPPALTQGLSLESALGNLPKTPDWQSADLSYESALRQLEAAQAATGLRLTGGANYNLNSPIQPAGDAQNSLAASLSASLGVLPWGSVGDGIRSALRALERAALTRRDARNSLYINVVTQYFNLRQATSNANLAKTTLALRQNQLRIVSAQNQAGTATLEQLLTAQQNLDSAGSNTVTTAGNLELTHLSLANTLGLSLQGLGEPSSAPSEPPLPSDTLESLLAKALANRSDVLKAQSQLQDAQDSLGNTQRDRLFPDSALSLGYSSGSQGNQTTVSAGLNFKTGNATLNSSLPIVSSSSSGTSSSSLNLGLSLSLPILDPSADSKIASAQTALTAVQASLEAARHAAELDVRQKYLSLQTAKASIKVSQSALTSAEQSLKTAQAKLAAGTGTALDVQSAQLNLAQAQHNLEAAQIQAQLAYIALQNATGVDLTGGNP